MIDWHAPNYIDLPDLHMAVFEASRATTARQIVLCHGWRKLAYSWRHIVAPLVAAGFHVLVPEQRGYGYTGPALSDAGDETGIPLYDMPHLCGDLAHLLDAYGLERLFSSAMIGVVFDMEHAPFTIQTAVAGAGRCQHTLYSAPDH